ncbi:MAG TPA: radical SAM protein [Polyangiaceae bacterium]|nr:radical SAM protein [Polyangiaceae bacterium]
MRVDLVNPPMYVNPSALTALRPAPPLGLAYVAAAVREAGHDVRAIDAIGESPGEKRPERGLVRLGLSETELVRRIRPDADVVGVGSLWSFGWPLVRSLLHAIRRARPGVTIVCGGEHFTALPEHSMREAPIDFVVLGEGEQVTVDLLARLGKDPGFDRAAVPGIVWRTPAGELVRNPRAARVRDVDRLPWPAWDLFDLAAYDRHGYVTGNRYGRTIPILATRGCPYQCTYCSSPNMWTTRWYARDPADVVDEIEFLARRYGANAFPFQDLTSIIKRDWIVRFSHELLRRDLRVRWQLAAGTRCEVVDEEVVDLLYRSGCRALYFAPESGSERTRDLIKKRMKMDTLLRASEIAVKRGLNLGAFLVIGFPHDTEGDLEETVSLARTLGRLGLSDVSCAVFFPIPSTELATYLFSTGRARLDDEFLMTPVHVHDRFVTEKNNYSERVSARTLTAFKYRTILAFYGALFRAHPSRFRRVLGNLFSGEETTKLDVFLNETKRALLGLHVREDALTRPADGAPVRRPVRGERRVLPLVSP